MSRSSLHRLGVAAAVAAAVVSGTGVATAAAPGFYVEGAMGSSSADIKQGQLDAALAEVLENEDGFAFDVESTDLDKSDIGFSFAAGYQFNPYFAVEAAYLDLGSVRYDVSGTLDDGENLYDAEIGISLKSRGPALSVIGSWPVSEAISLDARAGAYFGKTSMGVSAVIDAESFSESVGSDSKTGLLFGIGATWSLSDRVGLRLGYTMMDKALGERDVDRFSLGLRISF